jgi:thiosulfate/3-mercaptopyruvate sulfurtransferase
MVRVISGGLFALVVLTVARFTAADEPSYPRAELLLEPAELAKPENAKQFVILDARPREAYDKSHIRGARWVNHDDWSKAFGDGSDAAAWSKRIGALGIGNDASVVVYDDALMKDAARIWWVLRYWGIKDARLLNGGWKTYSASNLPTVSDAPSVTAANFQAKPHAAHLASKEDVLAMLEEGKFQIIDARSTGEFCGTDPGKNKRGGAIPGAKHLEWSDLIEKDSSRFKPADEIAKLFKDAGIDPRRPAATHCQSGGRASLIVFGLALMGANDVRNYYRGWSEWGNTEDTPVEPGKK